jgi:chorismate synthase
MDRIQAALERRRPGQSRLTTPRDEKDSVQLLSGVFEGITQGTPISMLVSNGDIDSSKYESLKTTFRPSHADFTYQQKYGRRDWRGGGRASARETVGRVAAGAVAEMLLERLAPIEIVAWVDSVDDIYSQVDATHLKRADVDSNEIRCPDQEAAEKMIARIKDVRRNKDTVGGCIRCVVRGVPAGWGEPVFDKLTASLAGGMMSIPATRGFEIGSGFNSTTMRGSSHNDLFVSEGGKIRTKTNHSGGIQGGISNGEDIWFRVAFKPVATIFQPQQTVDSSGKAVELSMKGRHDPCVLPRAVPIVESMCALTLADAALLHHASAGLRFSG